MGHPAADGRFGEFGGRFVPESLMPACLELEKWFDDAWSDPAFRSELDGLLRHYGGRPTPVTECTRLSERLGVRVFLQRQELNVFRMELLGAEVRTVRSGSRTLKDAVNEAMREWVATVDTTHYCLGSVMGPHPFPYMVR